METEKNKSNKKNTKVIITISTLVLIIIGLLMYIAYDKKIIFKSIASVEEKGVGVKKLDLSKSINTEGIKYSSPTTKEGDYGLSIKINDDKKSATLNIDWKKFGPLSTASAHSEDIKHYQITGFNKKIKSTFIGDIGQDSMGITLFFIMDDDTVEYMPMFINKGDHYEMNYASNEESFKVSGTLTDVENAYKLYKVNTSQGVGSSITTIAAKKDGSFYDLGAIINNTESSKEEIKGDKSYSGRYYLLGGKRRYYLAFDEPKENGETLENNNKAYIMDMNFSNSKPALKEINLANILKPLYDEKINSIPNVISEGTVNATPKSSCTSYKLLYGEVNDPQMLDAENEIPFQVNYTCVFNNNSEIGLGTEIYYLNATNLTIRHMGSF